nr:hypothetical protein DBT41_11740 [Aerococcus urinae]
MTGVLLAIFAGGALYRLRGAGLWPGRPWWHIGFALAYAFVSLGAVGVLPTILVLAATLGAVLTGHASYIDLGSVHPGAVNQPADGQTDEWYGAWLPGSGYWHDFAGLIVSGLLISSAAGAALIYGGAPLAGTLVLLSGGLKAPAYAAGAVVARNTHLGSAVALGEAFAGAALWGSLAIIMVTTL